MVRMDLYVNQIGFAGRPHDLYYTKNVKVSCCVGSRFPFFENGLQTKYIKVFIGRNGGGVNITALP
jgi:hypothetical protein